MDKNPIKHGSLEAAGLKFETGQSDGSAADEARQGQPNSAKLSCCKRNDGAVVTK